ncbi:MAG: hypothetical protein DWQ31_06945 [Planctomycetota bacterium]|nr:MAG: hypothetical protein DWQ31_06945 [Planctomycetota bacterium]REJ97799.1 MAG: hypothetical protein DWQ35_01295 [Planctomycetota bacterium]
MGKKLRITRNQEANDLVAHIQDDDAMMSALKMALREFWDQSTAEFVAAGRSGWDLDEASRLGGGHRTA